MVALSLACQGHRETRPPASSEYPKVKLGLEVLLEKRLDLIRGKRVGLITNPSGVDSHLQSTVDLLARNPEIQLVALYGPEHGVRGDSQAGEYVPFYIDKKYHIPVFSLYGQSMKPESGMLKNIDEYMRSFDTREAEKIPEKSMVKDIDVMIYDIQDVGTRVYTYIATMAYAMQACAESGIDFIVLDRPDPINGLDMEGPVLEYPEYSSFVGLYPVPLRIGLTMGEMARLFNDKFLAKKAKLTVIPMEGWQRTMWYDQTPLPWVFPSPNIPTLGAATVYPGQVFLEGTNVSEGRGTTRPFELFGAPWIDGFEIAKNLNELKLAGVVFREAWFTPTFSKFQGKICGGAELHVVDRSRFLPLATTLNIIKTIRDMYPRDFQFHKDYFDKIMGTSKVREALERRTSIEEITRSFAAGLTGFAELRKAYLLY
jgi:uncharacterized protein YbbC (DUF1343 family)